MSTMYPFTVLIGQESMKLALILNVITPSLSGVLICGEKGTAKSTAVRALASILPLQEFVENCPFRRHPADPDDVCSYCPYESCRMERLVKKTLA